jgi:hypothetical protein
MGLDQHWFCKTDDTPRSPGLTKWTPDDVAKELGYLRGYWDVVDVMVGTQTVDDDLNKVYEAVVTDEDLDRLERWNKDKGHSFEIAKIISTCRDAMVAGSKVYYTYSY